MSRKAFTIEAWAVICNGANLGSGSWCYQYSHSECYCNDYSTSCDASQRNWALAPDEGKTSTKTNCDCRKEVPLTAVSCKIYNGTTDCV